VSPDGNGALCAEDRLFKLQVHVLAQIGATLRTGALPVRPSASSEHISEAEQIAEDIVEILEDSGIESRASAGATDSSMTKAIIESALFAVRQDRVGFAALLELLFRVGIVGIAVRMELQREFAVCALDLLLGGRPLDAQDLVIVAFSVARRNSVFDPFRKGLWCY